MPGTESTRQENTSVFQTHNANFERYSVDLYLEAESTGAKEVQSNVRIH